MTRSTSNAIHGVSTLMLFLQTATPTSGLVTPPQLHHIHSIASIQSTQLGGKLPSFDGAWNPEKMTEHPFESFSKSRKFLLDSMGQQKEELVDSMEQQKEQLHQQQKPMVDLIPFHKRSIHTMEGRTDSVLMGGHKPDIIQMAVTAQDSPSGSVAGNMDSSVISEAVQLIRASNGPSQLDINADMEVVPSIDMQADLQVAQLEAAKAAVLDNNLPADVVDMIVNIGPHPEALLVSAAKNTAPIQDAGVAPVADQVSTGSVDMMTSQARIAKEIMIPAIDANAERVSPVSTTDVMQALQDVTVNAKQQMSDTVAASKFHFLDNTGQNGFEVKEIGEGSTDMLHKLADGMVGSMECVSQNLLTSVEEMMKEPKGGFAASELLHSAQDSIQKIVDGGIESVMATVNSVGDITVRDMITNLVSLVTLVVKVLFQLVSTLVAAASGKGIAGWVDQTSAAIHQGALALQDQAEHFSNDLSHQSLNEMVAMVDSYLHASTTYMAETATTVLNMGEITGSLAVPLVSAIFTEGVSSTWDALSDKF